MSVISEKKEQTFNTVDLSAEVCPMSFVKAKLHLERLAPGELIEFVINTGEQVQNVPRSIKDEGHCIESVRREGDRYHLLVRKAHPDQHQETHLGASRHDQGDPTPFRRA